MGSHFLARVLYFIQVPPSCEYPLKKKWKTGVYLFQIWKSKSENSFFSKYFPTRAGGVLKRGFYSQEGGIMIGTSWGYVGRYTALYEQTPKHDLCCTWLDYKLNSSFRFKLHFAIPNASCKKIIRKLTSRIHSLPFSEHSTSGKYTRERVSEFLLESSLQCFITSIPCSKKCWDEFSNRISARRQKQTCAHQVGIGIVGMLGGNFDRSSFV